MKNSHGMEADWLEEQGYFGRHDCIACNFAMLGANRTLIIKGRGKELYLCDGCANLIAKMADGRQIGMSGYEVGE